MTERGILFSAPLVRAILEDRKSQTRRVMRPQPQLTPSGLWNWRGDIFGTVHHESGGTTDYDEVSRRSPYGVPGDRLYVRETWNLVREVGEGEETWYESWEGTLPKEHPEGWVLEFRATEGALGGPWRPSIHMPKWASRIWLELTGVWVERLQSISVEDAIAEGVADKAVEGDVIGAFAMAWDMLNQRRGYGWKSNPWCWCLSFRMIGDEVREAAGAGSTGSLPSVPV